MTKKVITSTNTNEELIKKSTFIGVCTHINSNQDFFSFLKHHQNLTATHNCWAYRIGSEYRFNDDGEPSGTAGKPILAAIDGAGFDFLGALVIRHYGGIKLGTGGLARAYGGTIAKNLQQAQFTHYVPLLNMTLQLPFEFSQHLFKVTADLGGQLISQDFNAEGMRCEVSIPKKGALDFKQTMKNYTKGQITFTD